MMVRDLGLSPLLHDLLSAHRRQDRTVQAAVGRIRDRFGSLFLPVEWLGPTSAS